MSFVAFEITELKKKQGYYCLWCLAISSNVMNMVTQQQGRKQSLHIYTNEKQRDNALQYWRRQHTLTDTVFFLFEIPIDFYLEKAEKQI